MTLRRPNLKGLGANTIKINKLFVDTVAADASPRR